MPYVLCRTSTTHDKLVHISRMNEIYSGAVLAIVAIAGRDANAGLAGVGSKLKSVSQTCETIQDLPLVTKLLE
jgi:hypothetical protein